MSDDDRMRTERCFPGWAAEEHMRAQRARIDAALAVVAELREEAARARADAAASRSLAGRDILTAAANAYERAADRIERALRGDS